MMNRQEMVLLGAGAALLILSAVLRARGSDSSWYFFVPGALAIALAIIRVWRARPRDDPFRRFTSAAFSSDPRQPLYCRCDHELRHHLSRLDQLECTRCEEEGKAQSCVPETSRPVS